MEETSFYTEVLTREQFKIDYPYYGLFGSAVVTPLNEADGVMYRCRLLNGTTIFLKKLFQGSTWVDTAVNGETTLSRIIGPSIDDFLKIKKGV